MSVSMAKKRSPVWKHFTAIDPGRAECGHCRKQISFAGGGVGNLSRHMKFKHKSVPIDSDFNPLQNDELDRKSVEVWTHFTAVEGATKAECQYCGSMVTITGGVSANLIRHMEKRHPTVPIEEEPNSFRPDFPDGERSRSPVKNDESNSSPEPPSSPKVNPLRLTPESPKKIVKPASMSTSRVKLINDQIVRAIVKGYHPYRLVEDEEFKKLINIIAPAYTIPSKKHISSSMIPEIYLNTNKHLKDILSEVEAVCLTMDGWTSVTNNNFLAITVHFIDNNADHRSYSLGCIDYDTKNSAKNLSLLLQKEISKWGIENKVCGVIFDNTSNVAASIKLKTSWNHFSCFAHSINMVVQDSLIAIRNQLDKVKVIVEYFRSNNISFSIENETSTHDLKLKQDVPTRWNSTYDMLQRIVAIKEAVLSTLEMDQSDLNTLSGEDWTIIEQTVEVLKIFYEVSLEMCSQKYVPISEVIIMIKIIKENIANYLCMDGPEEFVHLVRCLENQMNLRFADVESNELTSQASFLDPRFKLHIFSNEKFSEDCLRLVKIRVSNLSGPSSKHDEPMPAAETKSSSVWSLYDIKVENILKTNNSTSSEKIEVNNYLKEPLLHRNEDPLKWWDEHRQAYPRLYRFMLHRLCVVATAVPCDRMFSKQGDIVTELRSHLKPDKASQILFLNHNL